MVKTYSMLAMTPTTRVESWLPPKPTSITLHRQKWSYKNLIKINILYQQGPDTKLDVSQYVEIQNKEENYEKKSCVHQNIILLHTIFGKKIRFNVPQ
jgi:hypothetical protein